MQSLDDEEVETNALTQYDSDRARVQEQLAAYMHDEGDDAGEGHEEHTHAVPTEVLQEDMDSVHVELPSDFRPGRVARTVADNPRGIITVVFAVAALLALWVGITGGEKFSVSEDLFIARSDDDVKHFYELGHLETAAQKGYGRRLSDATPSSPHADANLSSADAFAAAFAADGAARAERRRRASSGEFETVTLVYERRGLGAGNMLYMRQLKAMHDFEQRLWEWMLDRGVCYQAGGGGPQSGACRPIDSVLNYMYPYYDGGDHKLSFDGRMDLGRTDECDLPPFTGEDVEAMMAWLTQHGRDGFLSEEEDAEGTDADERRRGLAYSTRHPRPPPPPPPGNSTLGLWWGPEEGPSSKYLRSTLYLDPEKMATADWYALAHMLYRFSTFPMSKSWYVRVYYGGPSDLLTASLLVLLSYDLGLIMLSITLIGAYMRLYFGQWRLAILAALQIVLSFPLMYWFVCVPFGQAPLSAFAAASLCVVVGVSADNIFVFHETWGQARMLRVRGQRVTDAERLEWTIRQASVPLFFANATTAASLLINCLSPIQSIFQFGLCGGVLIFVNFGLTLTYLPALLFHEERGGFSRHHEPPDPIQRERDQQERMLRYQGIHEQLWGRRVTIMTAFAAAVVLLAPAALSLSPGADSSFTFAPDPAMQQVIARARLPPTKEGHLFKSAEADGHTTEWSATLTPSQIDHATPRYYAALLSGGYTPPLADPNNGKGYGIVLALLCLYDGYILNALARVITSGDPIWFWQRPDEEPPPVLLALLDVVKSIALVTGLALFFLSNLLCDFSNVVRHPVATTLGLLLLGHSAFFGKIANVAYHQTAWACLRVSEWMDRDRETACAFYGFLSAACAIGGIVILSLTLGGPSIGWIGGVHFGWLSWGPAGAAFWLALLWLYNGFMLSLAARAAITGEPIGHFRPRPEYRVRLAVASGAHTYCGWALLLLAGLPIARDLPSALSDILALWLAVNGACHVSLFRVIYGNRGNAAFVPTEYSERRRDAALLIQAMAAAFFFIAALVAWFMANNPVVCDSSDDDHSLSLYELQQCIVDLHLGWVALHLPTPSAVFLGACLATIWIGDALLASTGARVLRYGVQIGFLGPISSTRDGAAGRRTMHWLRRLRVWAAGLGLGGGLVAILTLSPPAFAAAFGPNAIIASNLLAFTLLAHVPFFTILFVVFSSHSPYFMLHPTEASRSSRTPAHCAAFGALFCLVTGLTILITQDSIADLDWPAWAGFEGHGLVLFGMLFADSALLLTIADVQYAGERFWCLRPMPDYSEEEQLDLGDHLANAGGVVQWAAFVALFLAVNREFGSVLWGVVRVLPMLLEMALGVHGIALFFTAYLFRRSLALGVLEPPTPEDDAYLMARYRNSAHALIRTASLACLSLSFLMPLLDGWHWYEAFTMLLFGVLVVGVLLTHGLYTGGVLGQAVGLDRRTLRRAVFGGTVLVATLTGACLAYAITRGGEIRIEYHVFMPVQYMLIVGLSAFSFINLLPIATAAEVWYTGVTVCGFSAEDAPIGRSQVPSALALLVAAIGCSVAGGALWATAAGVISLDDGYLSFSNLPEIGFDEAETCAVYFGADGEDPHAPGKPLLFSGYTPSLPSAQAELFTACTLLLEASSPLHSEGKGAKMTPRCFFKELQEWLASKSLPFPVPQSQFDQTVVEFLRAEPANADLVGLDDSQPPRVTFVRAVDLQAKFAHKGEAAIALLSDPILVLRYKAEWEAWLANLPAAVRTSAPPAGMTGAPRLPPSSQSPLRFGLSRCAKWSALSTEMAFFSSVQTALSVTPMFSMGAIALFTRSLIISYVALYCLVGMILTLLGLMHLLSIPLGVTSALALGLVIGMSVDYIIHLAHAYKNSLFAERFYKSRAAIFARGSSICSAAATTFAAVLPLLQAQLLPLREFGQIFALVTVVSLLFSVAFLVILMVVGPRKTRGARLQEEDPDEGPRVTEPHSQGDGWALQLEFGERAGPHGRPERGAGGGGIELKGGRVDGGAPPNEGYTGRSLAAQDSAAPRPTGEDDGYVDEML